MIIGTVTPQAAAIGVTIIEVLSPTPPVLCLSIFFPGMDDKFKTVPESRISRVKVSVSSVVMPFR